MHLSYFNPDPDTCYGDCCASNEDKELIQMLPELYRFFTETHASTSAFNNRYHEIQQKLKDMVDDSKNNAGGYWCQNCSRVLVTVQGDTCNSCKAICRD